MIRTNYRGFAGRSASVCEVNSRLESQSLSGRSTPGLKVGHCLGGQLLSGRSASVWEVNSRVESQSVREVSFCLGGQLPG